MDEFQARLARIALDAVGDRGFVLGGGHAVQLLASASPERTRLGFIGGVRPWWGAVSGTDDNPGVSVAEVSEQAWHALGAGERAVEVRVGDVPNLSARLPVADLAGGTVAVCVLAAAELAAVRGRRVPGPVLIDPARVASAFVSERHLRAGGRSYTSFGPLSAFLPAADGWVRTHANYPHHLARLRHVLGDDVAGAVRRLPAVEVEQRVNAAGGLAAAVRTAVQWAAHPQGRVVAGQPLIGRRETPAPASRPPAMADGLLLPASGVRVLDLTRVIAGPVATRTLALLGADVLRVDCPRYPELEGQHLDTGIGKRSTLLDLDHAADRATFEELLAAADVVVTGYRPGALDRYGLHPDSLLERRPGLVVARLSAWGTTGPWAGRRGFDSLVQATSGIAVIEGSSERPGVLPAQALDHGTGYLLAAAVLRSLAARYTRGNAHLAELALAGTAVWLMQLPPPATTSTETAPPTLAHLDGTTCAQPAVVLPGGPQTWTVALSPWGTDPPRW